MSNTLGLRNHIDYQIDNDTYIKNVNRENRSYEVEIGDKTKVGQFFPQLKSKLFNNHCNFSLRLMTSNPEIKVDTASNKIYYETAKEKVDFFETTSGYEIAINLLSKPIKNTITFSIKSKNVSFHFQKNIDDMTPEELLEIPAIDPYQPEHIKDSYVVYATSPPPKSYKGKLTTNKVAHIHRVWAEDSLGVRVWCKMEIRNSKLTITIPQNFLDTATYPVLVDPDFGFTDIGGSQATISTSTKNVCDDTSSRHHTASANEQIDNFSFYGRSTTGESSNIEIGAYDMSTTNEPHNANLATSADCNLTSATAGWVTSSNVNVALTSGNKYSIAIGDSRPGGAAAIKGYYDALGGSQVAESSTTGALDATFNNDDGHLSYVFSAYATISTTGGGSTYTVVNQLLLGVG